MKSQLHYLSVAHCATPVTVGSELPGVRTSCFQQEEMNNSGPSTTFIKGREKQYTIRQCIGIELIPIGEDWDGAYV